MAFDEFEHLCNYTFSYIISTPAIEDINALKIFFT